MLNEQPIIYLYTKSRVCENERFLMMEVTDDSKLNLMRIYSTFAEISQALTLLEEKQIWQTEESSWFMCCFDTQIHVRGGEYRYDVNFAIERAVHISRPTLDGRVGVCVTVRLICIILTCYAYWIMITNANRSPVLKHYFSKSNYGLIHVLGRHISAYTSYMRLVCILWYID